MNSQNKYCMYCMAPLNESADICPVCHHSSGEVKSKLYQLPAGTLLNQRYIVGRVLGSGGFGITYVGRDLNLDMKVAVKEYYPIGFSSRNTRIAPALVPDENSAEAFEEGKERFLREARIMAKFVDEKNIVGVRDFFEANNTCYIVMDFISGTSLKDYLASAGRMSVTQTLNLLMPVMDSLASVHKEGLIHRDISPDNIMLTEKGQVRLLDFGAARNVAGNTKTATVILKEGYAPIEQYSGKGELGPWTDVYAMAATMYRCITGQIPPSAVERLSGAALTVPSAMGIEISPDVESAIMNGLSVFKDRRWQSIEDFKKALLMGQPDNSRRNPVSVQSRRSVLTDDGPHWTSEHVEEGRTVLQNDDDARLSLRQGIGYGGGMTADRAVTENRSMTGARAVTENRGPAVSGAAENSVFSDYAARQPEGKAKKKKGRLGLKILGGFAAAVVLLIAVFVIKNFATAINIGGRSFDNSDTYVSVYAGKVTTDQLKKIHKFRYLCSLKLSNCYLTDADVKVIADELKQIPVEKLIVNLSYNPEITDISPLAEVESITEIDVSGCSVTDFSALAGCEQLSELSLNEMEKTVNTDSLKEITSLTTLNIRSNGLTDIEFVQKMSDLVHLECSDNQLTSLKGLEGKTAFHWLMADVNRITDISALKGVEELRYIDLSDNQVSDLSPLSDTLLSSEVFLNNNQIKDLSPLTGNVDCYQFEAYNNQIEDLSPLSECYGMGHLNLSGNRITEVTPLQYMKSMYSLDLSDNRITDISALSEMENTVLLYLNKNQIADISCLKNMVKLQTLKIDQNKIKDISVIEHLPELKHMYVAQNAIADISPLAGMNSGIYFGDLSGNQITDLSPLYDTVLDNILLIYDNPIQDGSAIQSLKFAGKGSLVISYDAGIDWTQVYASDGSLTTLVVLDVPGEREYDVKRDSPVNSVSFKSIEDYFSDESGESDEN